MFTLLIGKLYQVFIDKTFFQGNLSLSFPQPHLLLLLLLFYYDYDYYCYYYYLYCGTFLMIKTNRTLKSSSLSMRVTSNINLIL